MGVRARGGAGAEELMCPFAATFPPAFLQVREELETKPSNTKTKTKTGTKTKTKPITDVSTALDPLEGVCATLPDGYWSYKWCHRRDVIQVQERAVNVYK